MIRPDAESSRNRDRRAPFVFESVVRKEPDKGAGPRFGVTNLVGDGQALYERLWCLRGQMEKRIEGQRLQLFADPTSCHRWWSNQFRLLLADLVHVPIVAIRWLGRADTGRARARCAAIRLIT